MDAHLDIVTKVGCSSCRRGATCDGWRLSAGWGRGHRI